MGAVSQMFTALEAVLKIYRFSGRDNREQQMVVEYLAGWAPLHHRLQTCKWQLHDRMIAEKADVLQSPQPCAAGKQKPAEWGPKPDDFGRQRLGIAKSMSFGVAGCPNVVVWRSLALWKCSEINPG